MSYLEESEKNAERVRRLVLLAFLSFFIALVGGFIWSTATPGDSYDGPPVDPRDPELVSKLQGHVGVLAAGPRNLEQPTTIIEAVSYLTGELQSFGYSVKRQEVIAPADNLIVEIGAAEPDAPILIVGAHYDTAGASPGADDNASGVAALLELARALKPYDGRSAVQLILVFYANEEPPYFKTSAMGSLIHARSLQDPERVMGMIALESMGYFSDEPNSQKYPFPLSIRYPSTGDFIAFVGTTSARDFLREVIGEFREHARIPSIGGTAPSIIQGVDFSDHWGYDLVGVPAFMVTDTAPFRNPNYHRASDTPETLDYRRLALVVEALEAMLIAMIGEQSPPS